MATQDHVIKHHLRDWNCPNCQTVNTLDGAADIVTCTKCGINQLTYTVVLREQVQPSQEAS